MVLGQQLSGDVSYDPSCFASLNDGDTFGEMRH